MVFFIIWAGIIKMITVRKMSDIYQIEISNLRLIFLKNLRTSWPGPLPHAVLLDPEGKIIWRKNGPVDARKRSVLSWGRSATNGIQRPQRGAS